MLRFLHRLFPTREEYILTTVLSERTSGDRPVLFKDSWGVSKSALLLLSEGVLLPEEKLAVDTLVHGKGPKTRLWCWPFKRHWRLNLRALNRGNKGLIEIFEEIRKGEAQLRLRDSDGRVRRLAKRVRVFIRDESGKWWLVEVGRKYYNAEPKFRKKKYAVSGCIQNIELSRLVVAAQREVEQELGILFPLEAFRLQIAGPQLPDEHESDAYRGLISINHDYDVVLLVDMPQIEKWREKPPEINDTRITVYTEIEERTVDEPQAPEKVQPSVLEKAWLKDLIRIDTA
ncbi:NUDIX domain-containing protein [Patescibacteria group bacterium]|nr:NUDIX domain-containing protein [Patescibacteria group bacterium]